MCGISGLISKTKSFNSSNYIEQMTDIIVHRGPDSFGYLNYNKLFFGHRRLSILDLSELGKQPMTKFNLTITYNGEIYNYLELKHELEKNGFLFSTSTDTEVVLAAYNYWGQNCVNHFNGMWAFAILDLTNNIVFCSRDNYGIKPFVYTNKDNYFAFGSEHKQLTILPDFNRKINYNVVYDFFEENLLCHSEDNFFDDIITLQGGHNLIYNLENNSLEIIKWYLPKIIANRLDFNKSALKFKSLFTDSLRLRMRSDVKVGSCLSGGLDSSSIVATLKKELIATELDTVSSCFNIAEIDEREYVEEVIMETAFKSIQVFPDLCNLKRNQLFSKIIFQQDQPILSLSHFSEHQVFKSAAENKLIVMFSGQGADEYLAGYTEFIGNYLLNLLDQKKYLKYLKSVYKLADLRKVNKLKYYKTRIVNDVLKPNKKQSSHFLNGKFKAQIKSITKFDRILSMAEMSNIQMHKTSLPYQLHSEDRNSMMHSIESRLPFLDFRLVEYGLSLKDDFKIREMKTKAILRKAMDGIVPEKIIENHNKLGFPAYDEHWFKSNKEFLLPMLENALEKNKNLFNSSLVQTYIDFLNGEGKYEPFWLKAIAYQEWRNVFNMTNEQ